MLPDNFFSLALSHNTRSIAFEVGKSLASMHPRRAVIEVGAWAFRVDPFHAAGLCVVKRREDTPAHEVTYWEKDRGCVSASWTSWNVVQWNNHALELIEIDWGNGSGTWLIADTQEIARAFVSAVCAFNTQGRAWLHVYEDGYLRRAEDLERDIRSTTFDSLILHDAFKKAVREDFTRFLSSREVYERHGVPWKRGVIFIGPPGNGKTHAIKATINALELPCVYVKSIVSSFRTTHHALRAIFQHARDLAPSLLVLEDIDAIAVDDNRSVLLNELDGFAANTGLIVLASSNHPERLDPALVDRPSRFDRKYTFALPDTALRARYLERWNERADADMKLTPEGITAIAEATERFSFAYVKELTLCSTMAWIADPAPGAMDAVMLEQAKRLREQLGNNPNS